MKKYLIAALASVAALTLASCVKESSSNMTEEKTINNSQELITITARIPEGGFTKVDLAEASYGGAINLTWHEGDKIIVTDADDETNTQEFTLTDGEGTAEGTFTGKAVTADSYTIVYDSIGDEFEFSEQTQDADATTDHLKYKATLEGVNDYTDFEFSDMWAASASGTFNSSSVLRVRAKLGDLDPADVNAVILKANANIFAGSNELKVNIANPGTDAGEMDFITVYATMSDEDILIPAGTGLVAQFQMSDKSYDKYTVYRELGVGLIMEAGKVNSFNIDCGDNFTEFANKSDENIGTEENPYLIGDQHQMVAMHDELESGSTVYFKLVDEIDMTGVEWVPLNYASPYDKAINLDGGRCVVSNLSVTNAPGYPSFAGVLYGTIKNISFDSCEIVGGSNNAAVIGGYIGTGDKDGICENVTVSNSVVSVTAESKGRNAGIFAGVLGTAGSSLTNCHVLGKNAVTQNETTFNGCCAGGLIGNVNAAGTITDCIVEADVNNNSSYYTAGVFGQINAAATVERCAFLGGSITGGRVNDNSPVAGFVGYIPNVAAEITDCYVLDAEIVAPVCGRSAGFVGQVGNGATITSCYVEDSTISGGMNSGGFAGVFYASTLTKCYVTATTVTANKAQTAGFVAYPQNSNISYCYVDTDVVVEGGEYTSVGGFFGMAKDGYTATECFEAATVNGTAASVGAFVGTLDMLPASLTKCIAWDGARNFYGYSGQAPADIETVVYDNYLGKSGTISGQATTLGWDTDVWDLTGDVPVLK